MAPEGGLWDPAQRLLLSGHPGEWRNWQTRRIQVPVSERMWGFKSPLAHYFYGLKLKTPSPATGVWTEPDSFLSTNLIRSNTPDPIVGGAGKRLSPDGMPDLATYLE